MEIDAAVPLAREKGLAMNTATPAQIAKIIGYFEGVSKERTQILIETGYIASAIKTADVLSVLATIPSGQIERRLQVIEAFTGFENVSITVAGEPHSGTQQFQVRCWLGKHGEYHGGNVDQGGAENRFLFETWLPEEPNAGWVKDQILNLIRLDIAEWNNVQQTVVSGGGWYLTIKHR